MSENQDKKISYKILTAEELLKEETPPAKEIEHKEEKIEVPVAQKIEGIEEMPVKKEEVKERKEVVKPELKIGAGLIYPEAEKEEKPIEKVVIEPPQKVEIPIPKPTEILLPEIKPIKEEPPKEEIFYAPQKEREIPFRPKPELLQKEAEKKEIPEPVSPLGEIKREFKLPANLLRFVFLGGGVILIFLLILFLKPQEKFKAIFKAKEEKKEEEIKVATPTETVILFPTNVPTIFPVPTISTPTQPEATTPTVTPTTQPAPFQILSQTEIKPSEEIFFLSNYSSKEINLKNLDFSTWQEEFKKFLSLQEFFGTKVNINFLYNKNKITFDFLFDYFIKPTKISPEKIEELKNNFTGSYGFLIYYGHTRKYPILIFEVKDKEKALKFNQEWEKFTMKENLKTLFLGLEPPKTKNNFLTKKQGTYSYRILDFGDNFKIIWTLVDNYLIYATTEMGLKDILDHLLK
jgi:hypothetical protein